MKSYFFYVKKLKKYNGGIVKSNIQSFYTILRLQISQQRHRIHEYWLLLFFLEKNILTTCFN